MSRQPPLPPGLPPRPDFIPQSSHGGSDSYRPQESSYHRQEDDRSYSSRPPPQYQFRGESRNDGGYSNDGYDSRSSYNRRSPPRNNGHDNYDPYRDSYRPRDDRRDDRSRDDRREDNFTFRYDAPAGVEHGRNSYRPRSPPSRSMADRNKPRRERPGRNDRAGRGRGAARARGGLRRASDRAFLKTNRDPTPELMQGIDEDKNNGTRFRNIGDLSDSDETDMSVSEDENEPEQPKKKQVRTASKAADGDSVPRWSNPDPYTALPPPDESQRKKKDVVKLIRKARNIGTSDSINKAGAETDDFISFDDFEEDSIKMDELASKVGSSGIPPAGAPTGPRQRDVQPPLPLSPPPPTESPSSNNINLADEPSASTTSKPGQVIDLTSDPALGDRKRTIRDEIKGPPKIYNTFSGKPKTDGSVDKKWKVLPGQTGTPWVEAGIDHSSTATMGLWLHKEIMDFYHYVKPRAFEQTLRTQLIERLRSAVKQAFGPNYDIRPFGSFPAGLYLPTSDMDLVCVSDNFMKYNHTPRKFHLQSMVRDFARWLKNSKELAIPKSVQEISSAKVPIVKYQDKLTGLRVDVSFENNTGLIANETFQEWKAEFPAMAIIVVVVKHFLAMRNLNEPQHGGIGGMSTTCLVVSLLQQMPPIQSKSMDPEAHLGEILMEFFDLYGNRFNVTTTAISTKPPEYVPKNRVRNITYKNGKGGMDKFSIIDPNRSDNDIAGGSSNTRTILQAFSSAFKSLEIQMAHLRGLEDREKASVLGCILAGNYTTFEQQRAHLAYLHERLIGPIDD